MYIPDKYDAMRLFIRDMKFCYYKLYYMFFK